MQASTGVDSQDWNFGVGVIEREMSGCNGAGTPQHPCLAHKVNGAYLCSLQTKVDHSAGEAGQEADPTEIGLQDLNNLLNGFHCQ